MKPARNSWSRRHFLDISAAGVVGVSIPPLLAEEEKKSLPFASFDQEMEQFMQARKVPGGALAVVKNRKLVYARGYGWADREKKIPAQPDSLFRIASISKPFTAVAILKLVEEGRLKLEDRAFAIVKLPPIVFTGKPLDPRLQAITIEQLLHHTGGWDRDQGFDPMFQSKRISKAAGIPGPADPKSIIRFMLGKPLEFDPGTKYVYSNFGFCVLGRVIETITGMPYEQYVKEQVLAPLGIKHMRIGGTLSTKRAEGEVCYYTPKNDLGESVFPEHPGMVPWPDGAFNLEAMDAHGGWIASAVDLVRFAAGLDDPAHCPVLKAETLATMYRPPEAPVSRKPDGSVTDAYYGCGWLVRPVRNGKANYWHNGSLPGTSTLLVRRWDGLSWAVVFNQRSNDPQLPDGAIDAALHRAAEAVKEWPKEDLFARYQ